MSAPLPMENAINSKTGAALIDTIHTDIVCQDFADRLFIVLSQHQKLGTLVQVSRDIALDQVATGTQATYTTAVLFGEDKPELHAIARGLAEEINVSKPIIFALAIKEPSPSLLKGLKSLIATHKTWK